MTEAERKNPWAAALGRIPSGLFIVTACHDNSETGMLASWVMQCSFEPPQITVGVRQGRFIADWIRAGAPFVVNILDDSQSDMIGHFGRGFNPNEDAFAGLAVERLPGSGVVLTEALGYLECRLESSLTAGEHELFVARIVGGKMLNEGQPMVHIRKNGLHY